MGAGKSQRRPMACIVGLDLAGSPQRPTGFCVLRSRHVEVGHLASDADILHLVQGTSPRLVAIDAPLALPAGRCCLLDTCTCAHTTHFRACDQELRRWGIPFFPLTLGPMRQLTRRGMHLKAILEAQGVSVVETYPGAAQDLWGIPRQRDTAGLRRGLTRFRLQGLDSSERSPHVLDAVSCALVGKLHLAGRAWSIGRPDEAIMILPLPHSPKRALVQRRRLRISLQGTPGPGMQS